MFKTIILSIVFTFALIGCAVYNVAYSGGSYVNDRDGWFNLDNGRGLMYCKRNLEGKYPMPSCYHPVYYLESSSPDDSMQTYSHGGE